MKPCIVKQGLEFCLEILQWRLPLKKRAVCTRTCELEPSAPDARTPVESSRVADMVQDHTDQSGLGT